MKYAIVIPTFRRLDGSTPDFLKTALNSVMDQTLQDYKIFLIGDDYTDNDEFVAMSLIVPPDKMHAVNLPVAVERTKYSGHELWVCGGVNASNVGIELALEQGYSHMCFLDHDDRFRTNHLESLTEAFEKTGAHFVTTLCNGYPPIPEGSDNERFIKYRPVPSRLHKVGVCIDISYYNFRFRNLVEMFGRAYAADADMWQQISNHMVAREEYGCFMNVDTAVKRGGGDTRTRPEIIK